MLLRAAALDTDAAGFTVVCERSSFRGAMFPAFGVAVANEPWFWAVADGVALTLLFLNVLALVAVHARRLRQYFRTRRTKQLETRIEEILDELDPAAHTRDPQWLRTAIGGFDELEQHTRGDHADRTDDAGLG